MKQIAGINAPCWIGAPDWRLDARGPLNHPVAFRTDITLGQPRGGRIQISASPQYRLWVNGQFVGEGPGRCWNARQCLDKWDVGSLLRQGKNRIAALVSTPQLVTAYREQTRLGLFLDAEFNDGQRAVRLVSDPSWQSRPADWIHHHRRFASLPTCPQEHSDGDRDAWTDIQDDDAWEDARQLGPSGTPPWTDMEQRPIPHLVETAADARLVWRGRSATCEMLDSSVNLAHEFNQARCSGSPVESDTAAWLELVEGDVVAWDMGRTRPVRAGLDVSALDGDVRCEVFYAEGLNDRPSASLGFGSAEEGFCDSWKPLRPGGWLALASRGARFVALRVTGQGRVRVRWAGRNVDYPFPDGAAFTCADPILQAIWDTSCSNLRSSARDCYVDTCGREDTLWIFDACVSDKAGFLSFGESALWRRSLDLALQGIDARGVPRAVVPAGLNFMIMFDQAFGVVKSVEEYSLFTGDASLARDHSDAIARMLTLCEAHRGKEGLFAPPAYAWHWVDWAPIEKRAFALPINVMLLMAARAAIAVADLVGHRSLLSVARQLDESLAEAVEPFWDNEAQAWRSHLPSDQPVLENTFGRHSNPARWGMYANAMAVALGLGDETQQRAAAASCIRWLQDDPQREGFVNIGWVDILLTPLCAVGYREEILEWILKRYADLLATGMPTWPEGFPDKPADAAFNSAHGWSSAVNSLIVQGLLGLHPTKSGWTSLTGDGRLLPWHWEYRLETRSGNVSLGQN